ncbi:hypothetical protein Micbo1qcDRAFT_231266 [Microdochium bolleyi]|uniref:Uncharacterized protein n=1 Tax=Microdochium bolleyi TaxID=196109 RepID=A0A136JG93_9PEZI|nr:hypothetical protein Micbo1qcDRAFT_231266 [Microdochium bolleyi]
MHGSSWQFDLSTRAIAIDTERPTDLSLDTIPALQDVEQRGKTTVIVVQNVDSAWQARLSSRLGVGHDFFDRHISEGPRAKEPWKAVFGSAVDEQKRPLSGFVADDTLFLVDGGVVPSGGLFDKQPWRTKLFVPVSTSRGGLRLAPVVSSSHMFSLFHTLQHFFSHEWHLNLFNDISLSADEILYLVASSTWTNKLALQKLGIRRIAFDIVPVQPDLRLNTQLHLEREQLADLTSGVNDMLKWMPERLHSDLARHNASYVGYPDDIGRQLLEEAGALDRFLMDTFQLLMSTISVMAAESGLHEARSAQKLMWLASIYLPLTLVASIFGMNIDVINESPAPWWACVVTLVFAALFTAAILMIFERLNAAEAPKAEQSGLRGVLP